MSNIFDLFGATSTNAPRNQSKRDTTNLVENSSKSRLFSNNGNMTLKGALHNTGSKPKGLSLRPQSDSNICNINSKQVTEKSTLSKPILKPVDSHSNTGSCTPRNTNEKVSKNFRGIQRKLSPASKSPHSKFITQKQTEEFTFKKPNTPRQINKSVVYPEPEKLANYYNEKEHDRHSWEKLSLDEEFRNLMTPRKCITPFVDEGFISDPEILNVPPLSPVHGSSLDINDFDEVEVVTSPILLPEDDDNF